MEVIQKKPKNKKEKKVKKNNNIELEINEEELNVQYTFSQKLIDEINSLPSPPKVIDEIETLPSINILNENVETDKLKNSENNEKLMKSKKIDTTSSNLELNVDIKSEKKENKNIEINNEKIDENKMKSKTIPSTQETSVKMDNDYQLVDFSDISIEKKINSPKDTTNIDKQILQESTNINTSSNVEKNIIENKEITTNIENVENKDNTKENSIQSTTKIEISNKPNSTSPIQINGNSTKISSISSPSPVNININEIQETISSPSPVNINLNEINQIIKNNNCENVNVNNSITNNNIDNITSGNEIEQGKSTELSSNSQKQENIVVNEEGNNVLNVNINNNNTLNMNMNIDYSNIYPTIENQNMEYSSSHQIQTIDDTTTAATAMANNNFFDFNELPQIYNPQFIGASSTVTPVGTIQMASVFPPEYLNSNQDFVFVPTAPSESILFAEEEDYYNQVNVNVKSGKNRKKREQIYNKDMVYKLLTEPLTEPQLNTMLNNKNIMAHDNEVKVFRKENETVYSSSFYRHVKHYEDLIMKYREAKNQLEWKICEVNQTTDNTWKFERIMKNISRTCGDGVRFSHQYLTEMASVDETVISKLSDNLKQLKGEIENLAYLNFSVEQERKWIKNHINEFLFNSYFNPEFIKMYNDNNNNNNNNKNTNTENKSGNMRNMNNTNNNMNKTKENKTENQNKVLSNTNTNNNSITSSSVTVTNNNNNNNYNNVKNLNEMSNKNITLENPNININKNSNDSQNIISENKPISQNVNSRNNDNKNNKDTDSDKAKNLQINSNNDKKIDQTEDNNINHEEEENEENSFEVKKNHDIKKMKKYLNILFYFVRKYDLDDYNKSLYEEIGGCCNDEEDDEVNKKKPKVVETNNNTENDITQDQGDIMDGIHMKRDFKVKGITNKCSIYYFINTIRKWITLLVGHFLKVADYDIHQFILLHVLRTFGIGEWGASFVQATIQLPWNDNLINEYIARLNTFLMPVEEIKEEYDEKVEREKLLEESFRQLEDQGNWEVIRETQYFGPVDLSVITEEDYLSILDQFDILNHFQSFIDNMVISYKDNHSHGKIILANQYILKIISVSNSLLDIVSTAFSTFDSEIYPLLIKRLGQIISRMAAYYGETFYSLLQYNKCTEENRQQKLKLNENLNNINSNFKYPEMKININNDNSDTNTTESILQDGNEISNGYIKTTIQNEIDGFIHKLVRILISQPNSDVWQFLNDIPYHCVSVMTCWKIIFDIFKFKLSINELVKLLNEKLEHSIYTVLGDSNFINNFMNVFEESPNELIHVIHCLTSIALSRNKKFGNLIEGTIQISYSTEELLMIKLMNTVLYVMFNVSYIDNRYRDEMCKLTLDQFVMMCNQHPPLIASLLRWVNQNYKSIGNMGIYLFKSLPLYKYPIQLEELAILESFLTQPIDSDRFKFSQFVLQNLNLGSQIVKHRLQPKRKSSVTDPFNPENGQNRNNEEMGKENEEITSDDEYGYDYEDSSEEQNKKPLYSLTTSIYLPRGRTISNTDQFLSTTIHRKIAYVLVNTALKIEKEYKIKSGLLNLSNASLSILNPLNLLNDSKQNQQESNIMTKNSIGIHESAETSSEKDNDNQNKNENENENDNGNENENENINKNINKNINTEIEYQSNSIEEFRHWCWELLLQLRLFQYPTAPNTYAQCNDGSSNYIPYQSQILMAYREEMKTNPMAAYIMLANTDLGHDYLLFQDFGWSLLDVINKKGPEKAIITICSDIFPEYICSKGIERVCHQEQFIQFFGKFIKSSSLFKIPIKNFQKNDNILRYVSRMIYESYQMHIGYNEYSRCRLLFWIEVIFSNYNDWMNNNESIDLLDHLSKISFTFGKNQDIINLLSMEIYEKYYNTTDTNNNNYNSNDLLQKYDEIKTENSVIHSINKNIDSEEFYSGRNDICYQNQKNDSSEIKDSIKPLVSNNHNSFLSSISQNDRIRYIIVSLTDTFLKNKMPKHENMYWFTFHALIAETLCEHTQFMYIGHLLTENPEITLNDKIITESITKPISQFTIYKWLKQILILPVEHELMPLYMQLFFSLFYSKVGKQGPLGFNPFFGYKFFENNKKNESLIKKLKDKLVECRIYHVKHTTSTNLSAKLAHLYNAMHLWINENNIHTGEFYIGNLKSEYLINVLSNCLTIYPFNKIENLWWEYVDISNLQRLLSKKYFKKTIHTLNLKPKNETIDNLDIEHIISDNDSYSSLSDSFTCVITQNKNDNNKIKKIKKPIEECSLPPPDVSIKTPILNIKINNNIDLEKIEKAFKEKINLISENALDYHNRLEKIEQLDRQFIIDLRQLYYTETIRNQIEKRCTEQQNSLNIINNPIISNILSTTFNEKKENDVSQNRSNGEKEESQSSDLEKEEASSIEDSNEDLDEKEYKKVKKVCTAPAILAYNYQKSYLMSDSQQDMISNRKNTKKEIDVLFRLSSLIYESSNCLIEIIDFLIYLNKINSFETNINSSESSNLSITSNNIIFEKLSIEKRKKLEKMAIELFYFGVDKFLTESKYYPPAKKILDKIVYEFGKYYILPSSSQVDKIFLKIKMDNDNIDLFISLFDPSVCNERFIELYSEVALSKELFNVEQIIKLLKKFDVNNWLNKINKPSEEVQQKFLDTLYSLISHCTKIELIAIYYSSLQKLIENENFKNGRVVAFKYLFDFTVNGTIEPSLYEIYINAIGGDIGLVDCYLLSSDSIQLRIDNSQTIEILYMISNTFYKIRNSKQRLFYVFSKYLDDLFDLLSILYCSLGSSKLLNQNQNKDNNKSMDENINRNIIGIFNNIMNYDDSNVVLQPESNNKDEDIRKAHNNENEINENIKSSGNDKFILNIGIVSPKTESYWKLIEYLFQPWIVLANSGNEEFAPAAWDIEHKSKIQKLLRTFYFLTNRYLNTAPNKTLAIQNIWNFYKKCIESRQPDYILYSINERFLAFPWDHYCLNYENVTTIYKWKNSKWFTAEVQRFLDNLFEIVDWDIPINNGYESIDYRIEMLLLIIFYLIRGTDDILPSPKQQESFFNILDNKCFKKINWSNLNSEFFKTIISECPRKFPSGSSSLLYTLSSLQLMTGANNITNDSRKNYESFVKINVYFEYICQLIKEQLQIFGTPINFIISKIGAVIKESLEFIDLSAVHTNEMQNDKEMNQMTSHTLSNCYRGVLQLMNLCQTGDCFFIELWIGISYYISSSTHYPILMIANASVLNNVEYMAVLFELCIQRYLHLSSHNNEENHEPWELVKNELNVPELELNEYIKICKNHGLYLSLYTYGLQRFETLNHEVLVIMNNNNTFSDEKDKVILGFISEVISWITSLKPENKEYSENNIILIFSLFGCLISSYPEIYQKKRNIKMLFSFVETLMTWIEPKNKLLVNLGIVGKTRLSINFQYFVRSILIYLITIIQQHKPNISPSTTKNSSISNLLSYVPLVGKRSSIDNISSKLSKSHSKEIIFQDEKKKEESATTNNINQIDSNDFPYNNLSVAKTTYEVSTDIPISTTAVATTSINTVNITYNSSDNYLWNCDKYMATLRVFPKDSNEQDNNYIGWIDDTIDSIIALQPDNQLLMLINNYSSYTEQLRLKLFPQVTIYHPHI